jgi:P-type Ca2+ transporter type 2C
MSTEVVGASVERTWYLVDASVAASGLGVDPAVGLSAAEAKQRLERYGPNRLPSGRARSTWLLFLDQFRNFLILMLVAAAILALLVGEMKDAIAITVVFNFNAVLGLVQERRAERSLAALKGMLVSTARVRRDATTQDISADDVVPGDIVVLEAGDSVPADGRLVATHQAEFDESSLTGESTAVSKQTECLTGRLVPLADRSDMAFMNTVMTRGRAEMVVTATGTATEVGQLAGMLEEAQSGPTPLQEQLDVLGKRLTLVSGAAVLVYLALGLGRGGSVGALALSAIALAVVAIPEGLPAVVTVTLAVGRHKLARQGAIVKRLASVETLGCTSVICSDKTGTLTVNQMTVRRLWAGVHRYTVTGEGYEGDGEICADDGEGDWAALDRLQRAAILCNDSDIHAGALIGDPTEGALVALARKGGIDVRATRARFSRSGEVPFDASARYMATRHVDGADECIVAKGAPEVLLARCTRRAIGTGEAALDEKARSEVDAEVASMAGAGLRVLAVASRVADRAGTGNTLSAAEVDDLTLLGLVASHDPPRTEARDAIDRCHLAGIDVKMITGDHTTTAVAIARSLGIDGGVLTGAQLDDLSENELAERSAEIAVFARVAPEHKVKIVRGLQIQGRVVAMTGDGVNDAPALKSADIGVAMGAGTEVSKEAAAMVLTDDNFATITRAVEQGRVIYDNIIKFVCYQLSTNIGAILTLIGAELLALPVPLAAIQMLWVNVIMDGPPAMALGVDPPDPGSMTQPPRSPGARILTPRRFARLLGLGLVMAVGTLGVLTIALNAMAKERALTLAFTTFVLFQVFNVFNARSERASALRRESFSNPRLWAAIGTVLALQVMAVQVGPFRDVFKTAPLSGAAWLVAVAVASSILWLEELRKLLRRRFMNGGSR